MGSELPSKTKNSTTQRLEGLLPWDWKSCVTDDTLQAAWTAKGPVCMLVENLEDAWRVSCSIPRNGLTDSIKLPTLMNALVDGVSRAHDLLARRVDELMRVSEDLRVDMPDAAPRCPMCYARGERIMSERPDRAKWRCTRNGFTWVGHEPNNNDE